MKVRFCVVVFVVALTGTAAWNCGAAVKVEPPAVSPRIAQVVKLVEAGVSEEVVLAYIGSAPAAKPNAEEIIYLHEAGISKNVIMAVVSRNGNGAIPTVAVESGRVLSKPVYQQPASAAPSILYLPPPAPVYVHREPTVIYSAPSYYDYAYYDYPYYRSYYSWPAVSLGFSFGHGHHGLGHISGHHGGHHWSGHRGGGGHHWGGGGGHHGSGIHFTGHSGRRH